MDKKTLLENGSLNSKTKIVSAMPVYLPGDPGDEIIPWLEMLMSPPHTWKIKKEKFRY